jgi:hypothetical protein
MSDAGSLRYSNSLAFRISTIVANTLAERRARSADAVGRGRWLDDYSPGCVFSIKDDDPQSSDATVRNEVRRRNRSHPTNGWRMIVLHLSGALRRGSLR